MKRAFLVTLVLGSAALAQLPGPALPSPFDRVESVALGAPFEYVAEFSGTLFVWPAWAPGDPALTLAVGDATDDGDGGVRTPCIKKGVLTGEQLTVVVTAPDNAPGTLDLHLVAAPETDATRSAAAGTQTEIAAIKTLRKAGNLAEARQRIEALIDGLIVAEGVRHSELLAGALRSYGNESYALALPQAEEPAWRTTLEHCLRTLPHDHPDLALARQNLAGTLYVLGDFQGARALFEQVLAVRSRTLPEEHQDLVWARGNLATTIKALGDIAGARALEEQVLAAFERTLPDDHPDLARARQGFAVTLRELGDIAGARALEEQVLAVRARTLPEDHPDLTVARGNLAATLATLGDLQGARALEEQVLAVRARTLPEDHPGLAGARLNLAATIKELGDLAGARALEEQVLALRVRTLPEDHPDLARVRQNLAATIKELGDLAGARALEEQVLAVRARTLPEDHPDLARARGNLAGTLYTLGDLEGARVLFEQVLAVRERTFPEDHPDLAASRGNLATTIKALGDLAGARALEEQVLSVFARTLPEDHPDLAKARQGLAVTLHELGDLAGARVLEEQVLAVRARTLPDDHPDLARARANLAFTLTHERAREGEGEREGEARAEKFTTLCGEYSRSLAFRARSAWLDGSTREVEERLAHAANDIGRALSFAQGLGVFSMDGASSDAAFMASECSRGAALVAAALVRTARTHPRYASARDTLAEARAAVAHAGQGGGDAGALERALAQREAAERELLAVALEAGTDEALAREPDVAAFAAALEPDEAAVAFRRYARMTVDADGLHAGDDICAFVLRPQEAGVPLARVELGEAVAIEAAIESWRSAVGAAGGRGLSASALSVSLRTVDGEAVRRLAWDPLLPAIGDARRILVVADDVLHTVPFDGLPFGEGLLGELVAIEHRLTLMELLWEEPEPQGTSRLVALGDVDYGPAKEAATSLALRGGPSEHGFGPLPHTGAEARGIAALFGEDVAVLDGRDAARDRITALAPNARFVHLATHGWFAPESIQSTADPEVIDAALGVLRQSSEDRIIGTSPMVLCGLALAGANLPADELGRYRGLVTAEEIAGWDLSNCELAVLSACDTNVGLRRAGQGVASLQKALHIAGARSVITSLWKVPDEATKELMLDFYRRLWVEQKPKRQALWEAKMRLRDAKDETGAAKYATRDWAAWVLTGDPD